jgi:hypothetical protein
VRFWQFGKKCVNRFGARAEISRRMTATMARC